MLTVAGQIWGPPIRIGTVGNYVNSCKTFQIWSQRSCPGQGDSTYDRGRANDVKLNEAVNNKHTSAFFIYCHQILHCMPGPYNIDETTTKSSTYFISSLVCAISIFLLLQYIYIISVLQYHILHTLISPRVWSSGGSCSFLDDPSHWNWPSQTYRLQQCSLCSDASFW